MATFPTFSQHVTTASKLLDDVRIDRAANGTARARVFYAAAKYEFDVVQAALTPAQRATLEAFYAANRLLTVDFVSDFTGATHTCFMEGPPEFMPLGANLYRARTKLVER